MELKIRQTGTFIVFVIASILLITFLFAPALPADAALPPRPTPSPTSVTSGADPIQTTAAYGGGYIELNVAAAPSGLWTIVQWLDANGVWHDVEGWRGTAKNGSIEWWVNPKDFHKGPFRWITFQSQGGKHLTDSPSFYLPDTSSQTVVVTIASGQ